MHGLLEGGAMTGKTSLYYGKSGRTQLGRFWLAVSEQGLVAVEVGMTQEEFEAYLVKRFKGPVEQDQERVEEASREIGDYLGGERKVFSLPIDWSIMRLFQQKALQATFAIPYGETRTYKEIAEEIKRPRAARAVGRVEATNPMPLVIPCHRVIGSDGKLHGYGMGEGLKTKEWLLTLEGALIA
jgi:methylated-DNA-[protein]-cysteine S-methyltransferase